MNLIQLFILLQSFKNCFFKIKDWFKPFFDYFYSLNYKLLFLFDYFYYFSLIIIIIIDLNEFKMIAYTITDANLISNPLLMKQQDISNRNWVRNCTGIGSGVLFEGSHPFEDGQSAIAVVVDLLDDPVRLGRHWRWCCILLGHEDRFQVERERRSGSGSGSGGCVVAVAENGRIATPVRVEETVQLFDGLEGFFVEAVDRVRLFVLALRLRIRVGHEQDRVRRVHRSVPRRFRAQRCARFGQIRSRRRVAALLFNSLSQCIHLSLFINDSLPS